MSILFSSKQILKYIRWRIRRAQVILRYGPEVTGKTPIVFGNAMPKSGSHLLTQILGGLTVLGPFVDPGFPPVNRSEQNKPLPPKKIIANIQNMLPGDIRYGYIHSEEPYLSFLTQPNSATIFIYRDPRDMLISHIFYAVEMYAGHGMHRYYNEKLTNMEERINAAITGVTAPGYELASVKQRYDSYRGWLEQPDILSLKFEDIILDRDPTLNRILVFLEARGFSSDVPRSQAVEFLKNSIAPKNSGTFRKGIPGSWREHFTSSNKITFNRVAKNLLVDLGYEQDQKLVN